MLHMIHGTFTAGAAMLSSSLLSCERISHILDGFVVVSTTMSRVRYGLFGIGWLRIHWGWLLQVLGEFRVVVMGPGHQFVQPAHSLLGYGQTLGVPCMRG